MGPYFHTFPFTISRSHFHTFTVTLLLSSVFVCFKIPWNGFEHSDLKVLIRELRMLSKVKNEVRDDEDEPGEEGLFVFIITIVILIISSSSVNNPTR